MLPMGVVVSRNRDVVLIQGLELQYTTFSTKFTSVVFITFNAIYRTTLVQIWS